MFENTVIGDADGPALEKPPEVVSIFKLLGRLFKRGTLLVHGLNVGKLLQRCLVGVAKGVFGTTPSFAVYLHTHHHTYTHTDKDTCML